MTMRFSFLSRLFLIAFLMLGGLTACSMFIGTLPQPDPLWKATVAFDSNDAKGCLDAKDRNRNCTDPDGRASYYLSQYVPAPSMQLVSTLEHLDFHCERRGAMWACAYSKSQPPIACYTSIRASISASFPANLPSVNSMHVEAITGGDPDNIDDRGCFPM